MRERKWKRITANGPVLIDGSKAVSWFVTVTGPSTLQVRLLSPGRIYVFLLEQAGVHQVQFSGIENAASIAPIATSRSVQAFIATDVNRMLALAPGGWQV